MRLGRDFGRLWGAYTVSTVGSAVAADAFSLIAVLVLASTPLQVSLLSALSLAAGAVLALPLGPWIEFRHKRPVMVGADLARFAVLVTVPLAYAFQALTYVQLAVVAVLVAVGQIVFVAASGPMLKTVVPPEGLAEANGRFESVLWTSTAVGPPVGGLLMGLFGPATTVLTDAVSYLLSAVGVRSIRSPEPPHPARSPRHHWRREIGEGWRATWSDRVLRPLFVNYLGFSAMNVALMPILGVLMLRQLHFTTFQYGLSLGVPCVAGIAGSRLSRRFPRRRVLLVTGVARVLFLPWVPLVGGGWGGLTCFIAIHTGTVFFTSMFAPALATLRLERVPTDRLARVLAAWTISSYTGRAVCTLAWGALATLTSPRLALAVGGAVLLASGLFLPWSTPDRAPADAPAPARTPA